MVGGGGGGGEGGTGAFPPPPPPNDLFPPLFFHLFIYKFILFCFVCLQEVYLLYK